MSWKTWSEWLYEKVGKKLQSAADEIQSWKIPEEMKPIISKVSEVLVATASMAWMKKFALDVCAKYDEEFAKKLIEAVTNVFAKKEE